MIIDAHQHFWDLSKSDVFHYAWLEEAGNEPIHRDFLPVHLKPLIEQTRVDRTVFVQTQHHLQENRWALRLATEYDWIAGVVGWVDLASPVCSQQVAELMQHPKFVGVRHITQDEPEDDFIVRQDIITGLRVLEEQKVPFDLLFYVKHLRHAATLGEMLPELPMVIDHLAKPHIKDGILDDWEANFRAAARHQNIYCKLSGMITEAHWQNWSPADLKPYVDVALDAFGPERLMFGSDWPVCELAGTYQQVFDALSECLESLSQPERDQVFGKTAAKFYGLDVSST
jgi:L-fuconolactonase